MKKERRKEEESIVPKVDREICRRNFDGLRCIHDEILLFERSRTERQSLSPSVFSFLSFFLNARDFWGLSPPRPASSLPRSLAELTSNCTRLSRSRTPTAARSSPCRTRRPRTSSRFSAAARGFRSAI